jgi:hypothetical protein
MIALGVVCVVSLAALWILRDAVKDLARLADQIDQRAAAERHVLAGRIQRPELFPVRPPIPAPEGVASEAEDVGAGTAAFEAAGRDMSGSSREELIELLGQEFVDDTE